MSRDLTMTPRRIAYAEEQEKNIVEQFRQISTIDTENIIIEAIERTKIELSEKGLETYNAIIPITANPTLFPLLSFFCFFSNFSSFSRKN